MRKGDARRQAILDTAERLFYERGYEHTSVQDVLDALNLSKGGFYHHFESKLSLLEAISGQRNEDGFKKCEAAVLSCRGDAIDKLNLLFEHGFFFGQESADFTSLMIRVIYQDGGVQLKEALQRDALRRYLPLMIRVVHEGLDAKLFYTAYPDAVARIALMLNNCMTDELARTLSEADLESGVAELLELINAYRGAIELLLNAPHGSIRMVELERAVRILQQMDVMDRRMEAMARQAL